MALRKKFCVDEFQSSPTDIHVQNLDAIKTKDLFSGNQPAIRSKEQRAHQFALSTSDKDRAIAEQDVAGRSILMGGQPFPKRKVR